jgi:hypothetical protein
MRRFLLLIIGLLIHTGADAADICEPRWNAAASGEQFSDASAEAFQRNRRNASLPVTPASVCDKSGDIETRCTATKFDQTTATEFTVRDPVEVYFGQRVSRFRNDLQAAGGWVLLGERDSRLSEWIKREPTIRCEGSRCFVSCPVRKALETEPTEWVGCYFDGKPEILRVPNGCRQIAIREGDRKLVFAVTKYIKSYGLVQNYEGPGNVDYELRGFNANAKVELLTQMRALLTDRSIFGLTLIEQDFADAIFAKREKVRSNVDPNLWDDLRISVYLGNIRTQVMKIHVETAILVSDLARPEDKYWQSPGEEVKKKYREYIRQAFSTSLKRFCRSELLNVNEQHVLAINCIR